MVREGGVRSRESKRKEKEAKSDRNKSTDVTRAFILLIYYPPAL